MVTHCLINCRSNLTISARIPFECRSQSQYGGAFCCQSKPSNNIVCPCVRGKCSRSESFPAENERALSIALQLLLITLDNGGRHESSQGESDVITHNSLFYHIGVDFLLMRCACLTCSGKRLKFFRVSAHTIYSWLIII